MSSKTGRTQHVLQVLPDRHAATVAKSRVNLVVTKVQNARTLMEIGQLDNNERGMRKVNVNNLGLCETKMSRAGEMHPDEYRIIYQGGNNLEGGVDMILDREREKTVK